MRCDSCPVPAGHLCASLSHPRDCENAARGSRYHEGILKRSGFVGGNVPSPFPSQERPNGRIRVGLVCRCLGKGGAEHWQLALLKSLDPKRFSWRGVSMMATGPVYDADMIAAHEAYCPVSRLPNAILDLAKDCDVLISWAVPELTNAIKALPRPPKIIAVSHSSIDSPWGVELQSQARNIDQWVAVSELAVTAIPPDQRDGVKVVWNAVDEDRLKATRTRAEMLDRWGLPRDARVAGYLGRLSEEKDPQAMKRLAPHLPDGWYAVVVGDGYERTDLAENQPDNLRLVGGDMAAGDVLDAFDVVVSPSKYESFGLTIGEALMLGKPLVATQVGILLDNPHLAHIAPIGADGSTLAAAVVASAGDHPDTMGRIAEGKRWAKERLSLDRFAREWESVLTELVNQPKAPGLLQMAANFTGAVVKHVQSGARHASEDEQARRKATCESCEHLTNDRCKLCGCVGMHMKRSWASSSCPDNPPRWAAVTAEE